MTTQEESLSSSWEQPNAPAQPDNVAENPLSGYAWTKKRGYFMLPLDAQEEVTGVEVWHHDSKTWKTVIGEGLTDDADDASHHSDRSWDYRWNEDCHFGKKT